MIMKTTGKKCNFKFNHNEMVRFTLTPYGHKVLKDAYAHVPPLYDAALRQGLQFWEFCRIFGGSYHMDQSAPQLFTEDLVFVDGEVLE